MIRVHFRLRDGIVYTRDIQDEAYAKNQVLIDIWESDIYTFEDSEGVRIVFNVKYLLSVEAYKLNGDDARALPSTPKDGS